MMRSMSRAHVLAFLFLHLIAHPLASDAPAADEPVAAKDEIDAKVTEAFVHAAGRGDLEYVRKALDRNPKLANSGMLIGPTKHKHTPLHRAAICGKADVCDVLIKRGADALAIHDSQGESAIHIAAQYDHPEVIKVLIAAGVDVNLLAEREVPDAGRFPTPGMTPLDVAAKHGSVEAAKALLDASAKLDGNPPERSCSALHRAVATTLNQNGRPAGSARVGREANARMIELLVSRGADFGSRDVIGAQPFHRAIMSLSVENVGYVLDKYGDKIDVNGEGPFSYRPLALAVEYLEGKDAEESRLRIIEILKEHHADVKMLSGPELYPMTPLQRAIKRRRSQSVIDALSP
jgi:ankyrin repeat protein